MFGVGECGEGLMIVVNMDVVENILYIFDVLYLGYVEVLKEECFYLIDIFFIWEYCFKNFEFIEGS